MRATLARFRDLYGAGPVHLFALVGGFVLLGYVLASVGLETLWNTKTWWQSIAVWFAVAIIAHDLVLFPLYSLADRVLQLPRRLCQQQANVPVLNYVRVPALGAALTFVVFLPGIVEQGAATYLRATGQTQEPFLQRWLLLTSAMFLISAVAYIIRRRC